MAAGHEHGHVATAAGTDQVNSVGIDWLCPPQVRNGVGDVLHREVAAEGFGGAIWAAEVGEHKMPALGHAPAREDGAVGGLPVIATPSVQADQQI